MPGDADVLKIGDIPLHTGLPLLPEHESPLQQSKQSRPETNTVMA